MYPPGMIYLSVLSLSLPLVHVGEVRLARCPDAHVWRAFSLTGNMGTAGYARVQFRDLGTFIYSNPAREVYPLVCQQQGIRST